MVKKTPASSLYCLLLHLVAFDGNSAYKQRNIPPGGNDRLFLLDGAHTLVTLLVAVLNRSCTACFFDPQVLMVAVQISSETALQVAATTDYYS